jgi:hypothetical protein
MLACTCLCVPFLFQALLLVSCLLLRCVCCSDCWGDASAFGERHLKSSWWVLLLPANEHVRIVLTAYSNTFM